MQLQYFAWIIGFLYTCSIGYFAEPVGVGLSICLILILLGIARSYRLRNVALKPESIFLFVCGLVCSACFAISTNFLVMFLSELGYVLVYTLLWYQLTYRQDPCATELQCLKAGWRIVADLFALSLNLFDNVLAFFNVALKYKQLLPTRATVLGLLITLPLLIIFHQLFSNINGEYYNAMSRFLSALWTFLSYVINLEFLLAWVLQSYIAYLLLLSWQERQLKVISEAPQATINIRVVLISLVLLFAFFIRYQAEMMLFFSAMETNFKAFSLYVQRGFWELLIVGSIGYFVWLIIYYRRKDEVVARGFLWWLLLVFIGELFAISIFAAHKIFNLQLMFGLKDQRVLATVATLLIAIAFAASLLKLFNHFSDSVVTRVQVAAFLGCVVILNVINLDRFITRHNPISYYINDKRQLDYAYLLTNSFDNVSEWPALITQAQQTGIAYPKDYYWGLYQSLCLPKHFAPSPSFFEANLNRNHTSYQELLKFESLQKTLKFNLHEYDAYRFTIDQAQQLNSFYQFIKNECQNQS